MSSRTSLVPALLTASVLLGAAGPARADFGFRKLAGQRCPAGLQPVTLAEARSYRRDICRSLGQWDVVRLAGGGSMDGPGYDCRQRARDSRELGHVLCRAPGRGRPPAPPPPPPPPRDDRGPPGRGK
ncbi:MAG: hypothetical protein AAFZ18_30280, partial [Myxococcota bacterium]